LAKAQWVQKVHTTYLLLFVILSTVCNGV